MNELKLRQVTLSDSTEIQSISENELGYTCSISLVENKIKSLDATREAVFVACVDDVVVGFIHVLKYDVLYFETMCNVLGLAVKKEFQKMGIGKKLLMEGENWAKENGIKYMRLNSGISRVEAHEFYRHAGYKSEKQQMRFIKEL